MQVAVAGTGARATMARHAVETPASIRTRRPTVPAAIDRATAVTDRVLFSSDVPWSDFWGEYFGKMGARFDASRYYHSLDRAPEPC